VACITDNSWHRSDTAKAVAPVRVRELCCSQSSVMGVTNAPRGLKFAASLDTQIPH
jgi:hypothetical protein